MTKELNNIRLLTNDVETTSIVNGGLHETGIKSERRNAAPLTYTLNMKQDYFLFIADFARDCPK